MRPLIIKIEGFQSFREEQIIDFEKLSAGGIFGIFGKTGSGKSSILDAMMFALYGDTGKKRDISDFINKNSDKLFVLFTFEIREGANLSIYTVRRTVRIRKGGSKDSNARLEKKTELGEMTVAEQPQAVNAALREIIGLSDEEFKKCVVLPQGEFASFIKATSGERTKLIGSLFNLERYGDELFFKVRNRKINCDNKITAAESQITGIGDFSYSVITDTQNKIEEYDREEKRLSAIIKERQTELSEAEKIIMLSAELYKKQSQFAALCDKKGEIESLAAACKRADDAIIFTRLIQERNSTEALYSKNLSLYNTAVKHIEELKKEALILKSEADFAQGDFDERGKAVNELSVSLSLISPDALKLDKLKYERNLLLQSYKTKTLELDEENKKFGEANIILEKLKEQAKIAEANTNSELIYKKGYGEGRICEIDYISDKLPAGELLFDIKARRAGVIEDINSLGQITLSDIAKETERLKNLKKEIEERQAKQNILQNYITKLTADIEKIVENGNDKKNQINEFTEKFLSLGYSETLTVAEIEEKTAALKREYKQLENKKNQTKEAFEKNTLILNGEIGKAAGYLSAYSENKAAMDEKTNQIKSELEKFGFKDEKDALSASLNESELSVLKDKVKKFENDFLIFKSDIDRLEKALGGKNYDEEIYRTKLAELEDMQKSYSETGKQNAVLKSNLISLKENYLKLQKIKSELKTLESDRDKLKILYDMVKGKAFMEYVSEEFIQEITSSASVHIGRLTGGRYCLICDGAEFMVEDNYCGGEKRSVNTLSGGETFLVSLSMSVALSEAIVRMSDKPIEFFFLDEGFGTLDRELCDTVMNTLDKLRKTHFTIGLISHVPELMQRLSYKLLVTAPTESSGSKVNMEFA